MRLGSHLSRCSGWRLLRSPPREAAHPCRKREPLFSDLVLNRQEQIPRLELHALRRDLVHARPVGPGLPPESPSWACFPACGTWWGCWVCACSRARWPSPPSPGCTPHLHHGPAQPLLTPAHAAWVPGAVLWASSTVIPSLCPSRHSMLEGRGLDEPGLLRPCFPEALGDVRSGLDWLSKRRAFWEWPGAVRGAFPAEAVMSWRPASPFGYFGVSGEQGISGPGQEAGRLGVVL